MTGTYASNDLVNMRRWVRAWINQGIQALNRELRTSKAQETCMSRRKEPKGEREVIQFHLRVAKRYYHSTISQNCDEAVAMIHNDLIMGIPALPDNCRSGPLAAFISLSENDAHYCS